MDQEKIFQERAEKVFKYLKKSQVWVIIILLIAIILGVYIRSLPMVNHDTGQIPGLLQFVFTPNAIFGGTPGLWDITTKTWTLGPDLDPWLFLRTAETIIETGSIPKRDLMRNVPLGYDNTGETQLLPYMISWTYKFFDIFGDVNIEFAGLIFPVIMFGLTIIIYFLFSRELFIRKTKKSKLKANIIGLIATFFMVVMPAFLSRTIAGIPEKESAAFLFLFLALYLYLKSWKNKDLKYSLVYSLLAGLSSGLLALIWGGMLYVFITIGLSILIAFFIQKIGNKEFYNYSSWIILSFFIMLVFSNRYSLTEVLTSLSTGIAVFTFFILIVDFVIRNTKIKDIKILNKYDVPRSIITIIIAIILLIVLSTIVFGPSFILDKARQIHQIIFQPTFGRWNITVAENRQPNFKEWSTSFGPFIRNIPIMFWLFFIGSIVLFKEMLRKFRKKDTWILIGAYVFLFSGIVFSRYSGTSIFNGSNFISKAFYYLSAIIFAVVFIYIFLKDYKEGRNYFKKVRFEYILLFSLFFLTIFSARGAVRLIMVLATVVPIFVSYLIYISVNKFLKEKDETWKIVIAIITIIILISSLFTFYVYYQNVKNQAYMFIPSGYNVQWQKAMDWVRNNTDETAIFAHWWDYGYWLQSIGNRPTIVDGGNSIVYWNYLMGRLVLTGDNQKESLEFLYSHNASYLLIDSTDIGKYGAFSSIGSNEKYDRYSWMGAFVQDPKQTQETNNQTIHVYPGGLAIDEDMILNNNDKEVLLPRQQAYVAAILLPEKTSSNASIKSYDQPKVIYFYNGVQYREKLRYLYINDEFFDFGEGVEGCAFIFPSLAQQGQGVQVNPIGATIYISPRVLRGYLAQKYLLDDPFENFPNFKEAYSEQSLVVDSLRAQGLNLPEFVYYNGIQGPIKIWEIEYTGDEEAKEIYLDTDYKKYINWTL